MNPRYNGAVEEAVLPLPLSTKGSPLTALIKSKAFRILAAYVGIAACLAWVFHDMDWKMLVRSVASINWMWAGLGVFLNILSTLSMGYRWHLLLKPLGDIRPLRTTQAIYAGFFINDILPMRMGEVSRALLVSHWMSNECLSIVPSMALERLFEGVWLAIGMGVTAILVPLPRNLDRAADIFGMIILGLVGLTLFLTVRKKKTGANEGSSAARRLKPLRWVGFALNRLREGFGSIGLSRKFFQAFFISMGLIGFQAVGFWCITKAYGLQFPFWIGAAVFFIVVFGTALPNAPANIGTHQFFCVVGLTLFGVGKASAAGFSIIAFVLLTLPSFVIGYAALAKSGIKLAEIRQMIRRASKSF